MTRMRSYLAGLAALAWLATPASAQLAPGMSGNSTLQTFGSEEAWRTLWRFGICYAGINADKAAALLATRPGTREEATVYTSMFRKQNQSCLDGINTAYLRVPPRMVRGALAEGMYRRVAKRDRQPTLAPPPATDAPRKTMRDTALCYVRAHPAEAHALFFGTTPGGKEEAAAAQRIMSDLRPCLPSHIGGVQLSPVQLRFELAEAMYHALPAQAAVGTN